VKRYYPRLVLILLLLSLAPTVTVSGAPSISITPDKSQYRRGDDITFHVTGLNAADNDFLLFQITDSSGTPRFVAQMDDPAGTTLDGPFKIPLDWPRGTYTMYVREDTDASQLLTEVSADFAVKILGKFTAEEAAEILEAGIDNGLVDELGALLNDMDDESAATLLLEIEPESGAALVEAMASDDLTEAAKTVEAAVKKRLGETGPEKAQEILDKIAETLDNTDTDALVDIFVEITGLPETPETVATVMEAMKVTKVLDVVSAWVDAGSLEELAEVFGYFTEDFLETIYLGMTTAERTALYPYLSEETVAALPELGEFTVSGLSVSPDTVEPGEVVTISVDVENVGTGTSKYTVNLKIDGTTEESTELTLAAGEDETVTWTVSKTAAKTYDVDVNGLKGSFTVEEPVPPAPAEFVLSDLVVSPASIQTGETVTVSVTVANVGEESGSYTAELLVDDSKVDEETVALVGGASETVEFTGVSGDEGTHTVSVGDLSGSFTVEAPPEEEPGLNWALYAVAGVVILVIAYVVYKQFLESWTPFSTILI